MPTLSRPRRLLVSKKAVAVRQGRLGDALLIDAELRHAAIAELIQAAVAAEPPLSAAQRVDLASLLLGGDVR